MNIYISLIIYPLWMQLISIMVIQLIFFFSHKWSKTVKFTAHLSGIRVDFKLEKDQLFTFIFIMFKYDIRSEIRVNPV